MGARASSAFLLPAPGCPHCRAAASGCGVPIARASRRALSGGSWGCGVPGCHQPPMGSRRGRRAGCCHWRLCCRWVKRALAAASAGVGHPWALPCAPAGSQPWSQNRHHEPAAALWPLQVSRGRSSPYAGQSQGTRRPGLLLLIGEHNCFVSRMEMGMTDVILNHRVITYL